MKNKTIVLVLAMLLLGFMHLATPFPVYACSCGGLPTAKQVMNNADVVFLGKVISITEAGPIPPTQYAAQSSKAVLFDVITIYKGELKAQYVIKTLGGSCRQTFTVGEASVVFAYGDDQSLSTSPCSYIRPPGSPSDEVALGPGTPIAKRPKLTATYTALVAATSSNASVTDVLTFASVTSIVVFGSVVLIIKRRRKPIA